MKVDGELRDLAAPLPADAELEVVTDQSAEALELLRHDAAHVLATAVVELYPGHQGLDRPADRRRLLLRLRVPGGRDRLRGRPRGDRGGRWPSTSRPTSRSSARRRRADEALERFRDAEEPYKVELIEDLVADEGAEAVSLYRNGPFLDLCRGPHGPSTGRIKAFKLNSVAGAYWRGDETPPDADPDLRHRVLHAGRPRRAPRAPRAGPRQRPPQAGPAAGPVPAAPGGARDAVLAPEGHGAAAADRARGARAAARAAATTRSRPRRSWTPSSGTARATGTTTARTCSSPSPPSAIATSPTAPTRCRPMNCPGACLTFGSERHSYRDLPLRLAEFGLVSPLRARGRAARPAAGPRLHPGRRPRLLHARAGRRRGRLDLRGDRRALRAVRLRRGAGRALDPAREVDRHRRAVGAGGRRRCARRSSARGASTR